MNALWFIAQNTPQGTSQQNVVQTMLWVGLLIGVFVVGVFFAAWVRKQLLTKDDDQPAEAGAVSLHTLRAMRDEGTLSEEEFEKAASTILKMSPGSNPIRDEVERRARDEFNR